MLALPFHLLTAVRYPLLSPSLGPRHTNPQVASVRICAPLSVSGVTGVGDGLAGSQFPRQACLVNGLFPG